MLTPNEVQRRFLASVADPFQVRLLFEHLPGILFFMKDTKSRLMVASTGVLNRMGVTSEADVVGSSDHEHFPREMADSFIQDDQQVLKTGQPLIDRLEIAYDEQRLLGWHMTKKFPVYGHSGEIVGIMGFTQSYDGPHLSRDPFSEVAKAVEFVGENLDRKIHASEMALAAGLSERSLNRKFHEAFHMAPHEFVSRTRIQAASKELVHTDKPIIEIAIDCGFCDQSAFTVQFRKRTGMTPRNFRKRYQDEAQG